MEANKTIWLDKDRTASFDVDPQKGFSELCPEELPVPGALEIVPLLNSQALKARFRLASKDCHNPNAVWVATEENPQFSPVGLPNSDIRWKRHCEVGTLGHQFLDGLPNPIDYDFVANKGIENDLHPYGACYHDLANTRSTGVIEFLRANNVNTVLVGGLATDYCVKNTAIQLARAGFRVVVNLAACRGIAPDTVINALKEMDLEKVRAVFNETFLEMQTEL